MFPLLPLLLIIQLIGGFFPYINLICSFIYVIFFIRVLRDIAIVYKDDVEAFVKEMLGQSYAGFEDLWPFLLDYFRKDNEESFYEEKRELEYKDPVLENIEKDFLADEREYMKEEVTNEKVKKNISYLMRILLYNQRKFYLTCNFFLFFTSTCSISCSILFEFGKGTDKIGRYIMSACFFMFSYFLVMNAFSFAIIIIKRKKIYNLIKHGFQYCDSTNGPFIGIHGIFCIILSAVAIIQMWYFFLMEKSIPEILNSI